MLKNKQIKVALIVIMVFSMVAGYAPLVNIARAASLTDVTDTISDSDLSATNVTHTITFTTVTATPAGGYWQVDLPDFSNILVGGVTCGYGNGNLTKSVVGTTVKCTATALEAATTTSIVITGTVNPGTSGDKTITVSNRNAADAVLEASDVLVYIIDDVTVTAEVTATLTFTIAGLNDSIDVNGTTTSEITTATTLPFNTLDVGVPSIVGQELTVATNATDGYTVTVEQDHNLQTAAGADIDSFKDAVTSTSAQNWTAPANTLDDETTYGHMGITSEDQTLSDGDHFTSNQWQGFDAQTPIEVMYHNGPADGTTAHKGLTQVAYVAQISALQEAGDYENTLTYICTPTY